MTKQAKCGARCKSYSGVLYWHEHPGKLDCLGKFFSVDHEKFKLFQRRWRRDERDIAASLRRLRRAPVGMQVSLGATTESRAFENRYADLLHFIRHKKLGQDGVFIPGRFMLVKDLNAILWFAGAQVRVNRMALNAGGRPASEGRQVIKSYVDEERRKGRPLKQIIAEARGLGARPISARTVQRIHKGR